MKDLQAWIENMPVAELRSVLLILTRFKIRASELFEPCSQDINQLRWKPLDKKHLASHIQDAYQRFHKYRDRVFLILGALFSIKMITSSILWHEEWEKNTEHQKQKIDMIEKLAGEKQGKDFLKHLEYGGSAYIKGTKAYDMIMLLSKEGMQYKEFYSYEDWISTPQESPDTVVIIRNAKKWTPEQKRAFHDVTTNRTITHDSLGIELNENFDQKQKAFALTDNAPITYVLDESDDILTHKSDRRVTTYAGGFVLPILDLANFPGLFDPIKRPGLFGDLVGGLALLWGVFYLAHHYLKPLTALKVYYQAIDYHCTRGSGVLCSKKHPEDEYIPTSLSDARCYVISKDGPAAWLVRPNGLLRGTSVEMKRSSRLYERHV